MTLAFAKTPSTRIEAANVYCLFCFVCNLMEVRRKTEAALWIFIYCSHVPEQRGAEIQSYHSSVGTLCSSHTQMNIGKSAEWMSFTTSYLHTIYLQFSSITLPLWSFSYPSGIQLKHQNITQSLLTNPVKLVIPSTKIPQYSYMYLLNSHLSLCMLTSSLVCEHFEELTTVLLICVYFFLPNTEPDIIIHHKMFMWMGNGKWRAFTSNNWLRWITWHVTWLVHQVFTF